MVATIVATLTSYSTEIEGKHKQVTGGLVLSLFVSFVFH